MPTAYIVDAVRTPIGKFGGALSSVRPDDLAAHVLRELMRRNPTVDKDAMEDVIMGAANQAGEDNRNVARMAALLAGLPVTVPGITVNRLCASGLQSIMDAARAIKSGEGDVYLAGGAESMTRAPFVMAKSESAFGRELTAHDTTLGWRFINPRLTQAALPLYHGPDGRKRGQAVQRDPRGAGFLCLREPAQVCPRPGKRPVPQGNRAGVHPPAQRRHGAV